MLTGQLQKRIKPTREPKTCTQRSKSYTRKSKVKDVFSIWVPCVYRSFFFYSFLDRDCENSLRVQFVFVSKDLLQKLKEAGTTLPSKDLEKMLRDAKRMVREMENRNFTPQKTAAEKEKDEAKKCKTSLDLHLSE